MIHFPIINHPPAWQNSLQKTLTVNCVQGWHGLCKLFHAKTSFHVQRGGNSDKVFMFIKLQDCKILAKKEIKLLIPSLTWTIKHTLMDLATNKNVMILIHLLFQLHQHYGLQLADQCGRPWPNYNWCQFGRNWFWWFQEWRHSECLRILSTKLCK